MSRLYKELDRGSLRLMLVTSDVCSIFCRSILCPFNFLSFDIMSVRYYVCSILCLFDIMSFDTLYTHAVAYHYSSWNPHFQGWLPQMSQRALPCVECNGQWSNSVAVHFEVLGGHVPCPKRQLPAAKTKKSIINITLKKINH